MAYDKIIPIKSRLDHCVSYVLNHEKTDLSAALSYIGNEGKTTLADGSTVLEAAINCRLETAYQEMQATKKRWGKPGGVLGYHLIHAFAPGEVEPEQAHKLGVEFAKKLLGNRYEAVISTHLDRAHIHCHIVFNSVSCVDGRKYRDNFKAYFEDIRGVSNEVSQESGLSVIHPLNRGKHYAERAAEQRGKPTVRSLIRKDIDEALARAFTYSSFLTLLKKQGYEIKAGSNVKYTAIKPPGSSRFIRLGSLGDGYTEADITKQLLGCRCGEEQPESSREPNHPYLHRRYKLKSGSLSGMRRKPRGFRALYLHYIILLNPGYPKRTKKTQKRPKQVPFAIRKEVTKLHQYQRQFRLLQCYGIETDLQLSWLEDALQVQIDSLVSQRKPLYRRRKRGEDVGLELESINRSLRKLRSDLRLCFQIEKNTPQIQMDVSVCHAQKKEVQHHVERKPDKKSSYKKQPFQM